MKHEKLELGQAVQVLEPEHQKTYITCLVTEVIDDLVLLYRVQPLKGGRSLYVDEKEIKSVIK